METKGPNRLQSTGGDDLASGLYGPLAETTGSSYSQLDTANLLAKTTVGLDDQMVIIREYFTQSSFDYYHAIADTP